MVRVVLALDVVVLELVIDDDVVDVYLGVLLILEEADTLDEPDDVLD